MTETQAEETEETEVMDVAGAFSQTEYPPSLMKPREEALVTAPKERCFQWKNQDRWPYRNFMEEYQKSPVELDAATLKKRWEGISEPDEIDAFFAEQLRIENREIALVKAVEEMDFDPFDPSFKHLLAKRMVLDALRERANIKRKLDKDETNDHKFVDAIEVDETGEPILRGDGTPVKTQVPTRYERPLRPGEHKGLTAEMREWNKELRVLTGQASDITGRVNVEMDVTDALRESMRRLNPEYAALEAIEQGEAPQDNGRMIDVTDETEIR